MQASMALIGLLALLPAASDGGHEPGPERFATSRHAVTEDGSAEATWSAVAARTRLASVGAAAQTPPKPPATGAPARQASRPALGIQVTDTTGTAIAHVRVSAAGPLSREGNTNADGAVRFTNMRAGTYRLRFEHDSHVTFEREVTIAQRTVSLDVALTPASAPPVPESVSAPPPPRVEEPRPLGVPSTLRVPAFAEANFIGRGEPQKLSRVGCTGYQTTRIIQVRDPMGGRVNEDADETLYVVAGEAMLRLAGTDQPLEPGSLAVIPRETVHTLARRGRNPVIVLSVLSGPPCFPDGQP